MLKNQRAFVIVLIALASVVNPAIAKDTKQHNSRKPANAESGQFACDVYTAKNGDAVAHKDFRDSDVTGVSSAGPLKVTVGTVAGKTITIASSDSYAGTSIVSMTITSSDNSTKSVSAPLKGVFSYEEAHGNQFFRVLCRESVLE